MRVRDWLTAAAMAGVLAVPGLAQSQTGTLRVSVRVPGTLAPVPGVQISVTSPDTNSRLPNLPGNEEDLLEYLGKLAVARGIAGHLEIITDHGDPHRRVVCPKLPSQPVNIASPAALTDADGSAVIPNLKAGQYVVNAGHERYVVPPSNVPTTVMVESGASSSVSLFLNPAATASGRVVDANGTPVVNACVSLLEMKQQKVAAQAPTDDKGEYRLQSVSAGEYMFRVQSAQSPSVIVYYPGVANTQNAATLSIEAGSNTVGIDLKIP